MTQWQLTGLFCSAMIHNAILKQQQESEVRIRTTEKRVALKRQEKRGKYYIFIKNEKKYENP